MCNILLFWTFPEQRAKTTALTGKKRGGMRGGLCVCVLDFKTYLIFNLLTKEYKEKQCIEGLWWGVDRGSFTEPCRRVCYCFSHWRIKNACKWDRKALLPAAGAAGLVNTVTASVELPSAHLKAVISTSLWFVCGFTQPDWTRRSLFSQRRLFTEETVVD